MKPRVGFNVVMASYSLLSVLTDPISVAYNLARAVQLNISPMKSWDQVTKTVPRNIRNHGYNKIMHANFFAVGRLCHLSLVVYCRL